MTTAELSSGYAHFLHGWNAVAIAYAITALFSLFGLKRGGAKVPQYVAWPFTSIITLVMVLLVLAILDHLIAHYAISYASALQAVTNILIMMAGGALGGLYWASRGRVLQPQHTRGAVIIEGGSVPGRRFLNRLQGVAPLTVAGVAVDYEDEPKHFKFMGTTGSGKSTVMRELLAGALQRGDRAVIADPDGAYLSRFYDARRGDVILNPFDARSATWDLFAELEKPYDIDQLARAMIPDRNSGDNSWPAYGRTFLSALIKQMQLLKSGSASELFRLLTTAKREELQILIEGTPAGPFLESGNERFFGSVRSTTVDQTRCLEYICAQRTAPFSVRRWVKTGHGVLFLPYQADQIAALKAMISTWMRLAIFQTLSLGEADHRIWFAVDELDALGPIDGLTDALPRLRKFGGRCVLGFQSISQVSNTYGQGLAQALVENCGNTLILRCSASENGGTSRFASRLIGEREVLRLSQSVSRSRGEGFLGRARDTQGTNEQHATEFAVLAAEIEQLPDRSGYLKFPSQPEWVRVTFPYFDVAKVAQAFIGQS